MRRRSFIAALAATFATPAKMLAAPKPLVMPGFTEFISIHQYRSIYEQLTTTGEAVVEGPLFRGEVGRYEGIRIIRSIR